MVPDYDILCEQLDDLDNQLRSFREPAMKQVSCAVGSWWFSLDFNERINALSECIKGCFGNKIIDIGYTFYGEIIRRTILPVVGDEFDLLNQIRTILMELDPLIDYYSESQKRQLEEARMRLSEDYQEIAAALHSEANSEFEALVRNVVMKN